MATTPRTSELALQIAGQSSRSDATPRREMAVVSPCSTCQNYKAVSDGTDPYRRPCPRRLWIDSQTQGLLDIDPILTLSGTQDPNTLANPAIDPATDNYLIWIAAVDDNQGITNIDDGSVVTPNILSEGFNNLYIRCRPEPFVPEDTHSIVKLHGHFLESDIVWATGSRHSSIQPNDASKEVPVGGTVVKGTFASSFNTANPSDHMGVPG